MNGHVANGFDTFARPAANGSGASHETEGTGTFDQELGERVRTVRLHRGMSQRELSEAIGVSREHLQNYEKGATRIHCGALWRIAKALDVRVGDLLENDEFSTPLDSPLNWRERELVAALRRIPGTQMQQAVLAFVNAIEGSLMMARPAPAEANDRQ